MSVEGELYICHLLFTAWLASCTRRKPWPPICTDRSRPASRRKPPRDTSSVYLGKKVPRKSLAFPPTHVGQRAPVGREAEVIELRASGLERTETTPLLKWTWNGVWASFRFTVTTYDRIGHHPSTGGRRSQMDHFLHTPFCANRPKDWTIPGFLARQVPRPIYTPLGGGASAWPARFFPESRIATRVF